MVLFKSKAEPEPEAEPVPIPPGYNPLSPALRTTILANIGHLIMSQLARREATLHFNTRGKLGDSNHPRYDPTLAIKIHIEMSEDRLIDRVPRPGDSPTLGPVISVIDYVLPKTVAQVDEWHVHDDGIHVWKAGTPWPAQPEWVPIPAQVQKGIRRNHKPVNDDYLAHRPEIRSDLVHYYDPQTTNRVGTALTLELVDRREFYVPVRASTDPDEIDFEPLQMDQVTRKVRQGVSA